MRTTLVFASFCALTSLAAWAAAQRPMEPPNADVASVAAGNNAFAIDLYARLATQEGNLFFSPHSIHAALGMTYAGAGGQTAQQMAQVLHFSLPQQKLHPAFAELIRRLNTGAKVRDQELYQLVMANALWGQRGYPFHKDFQDLLQRSYGAGMHEVDFMNALEESRRQINVWVEKQTKDKIKDLIPQGVLRPSTALVLTNAIYFKSAWAEPFTKSATKEAPFHTAAESTINVPMMNRQTRFGYTEDERIQAIELPYAGYGLSMLVLLPKKVDGLKDLEKNLTAAGLDKWISAIKQRMVELSLPKFKFTSAFSLSKPLQQLGMTDAFSARADFSGMASVEKLFIAEVLHKAFVDVNEEGTEAAAATAVLIARAALPAPEEPVVFKADHPFLFVIRHRASNEILFMGRVSSPEH